MQPLMRRHSDVLIFGMAGSPENLFHQVWVRIRRSKLRDRFEELFRELSLAHSVVKPAMRLQWILKRIRRECQCPQFKLYLSTYSFRFMSGFFPPFAEGAPQKKICSVEMTWTFAMRSMSKSL